MDIIYKKSTQVIKIDSDLKKECPICRKSVKFKKISQSISNIPSIQSCAGYFHTVYKIKEVRDLQKECQIWRKSTKFIERVPDLKKECPIYGKRTRFIERVSD